MGTVRGGYASQASQPGHPQLDGGTLLAITGFTIILGILFLFDIITTRVILLMGGVELNPLMVGIVASPIVHIAIKAAVLILIFIVALVAEKYQKRSGVIFYLIILAFYTVIVFNNLLVILPEIS